MYSKKMSAGFEKMNELGIDQIPFFFMSDFKGEKVEVIELAALKKNEIKIDSPIFSNVLSSNEPFLHDLYFQKKPIPLAEYQSKFEKAIKELNYGNSYLINLTQPTPIETNLSLNDIFNHSKALFRLLYKDEFVVFSPERFLKIEKNKIYTYPMKGTIDASLPNAGDQILNNQKELAEHNTIVDLLRNDLNQVAKNIKVKKFRYLDEIETNNGKILQVSSEIEGKLLKNWKSNIGSIFSKVLPAGSVTGAPKRKTVEIIQSIEGYQRGWYTGIFGVFDGQSVDSAVMIRFIEKVNNQLIFKSGGGLTAQSNLVDEYNELTQKVYVSISRND